MEDMQNLIKDLFKDTVEEMVLVRFAYGFLDRLAAY
jgi:hypothetical protein